VMTVVPAKYNPPALRFSNNKSTSKKSRLSWVLFYPVCSLRL
jgi:hypothetical protein